MLVCVSVGGLAGGNCVLWDLAAGWGRPTLSRLDRLQGGGGGFGRGEFHGENFAVKKSGEISPLAKFSRRRIQYSS